MPLDILVADDDPIIRRLYDHVLKHAGYHAIFAENGLQALEIASRDLPQLIIMDLVMQDMDGLTVLQKLKSSQSTKHIPVIIVTGKDDASTKQQAADAGAALTVLKPFRPGPLLDQIRQVLLHEEKLKVNG